MISSVSLFLLSPIPVVLVVLVVLAVLVVLVVVVVVLVLVLVLVVVLVVVVVVVLVLVLLFSFAWVMLPVREGVWFVLTDKSVHQRVWLAVLGLAACGCSLVCVCHACSVGLLRERLKEQWGESHEHILVVLTASPDGVANAAGDTTDIVVAPQALNDLFLGKPDAVLPQVCFEEGKVQSRANL